MDIVVNDRQVYADTGSQRFDPALPGVVFIHGAVCDHTVWMPLARSFAQAGHAVLAPDLPGHMRSHGPALDTVEAMADWALALLDAAGLKQAALVGHSMGSLVALESAARAPQRISTLVLIATALPMAVPAALLELGRQDPQAAVDRVIKYSFSPAAPQTLRDAARDLMRRVLAQAEGGTLFQNDFAACDRYTAGLAAAARVVCPSALVLADDDRMTPPDAAQALASALKATVHRVPGGHFPIQEQPDAVLAALRKAVA